MFRAIVDAHVDDTFADGFTHFGPNEHRPQSLKHCSQNARLA